MYTNMVSVRFIEVCTSGNWFRNQSVILIYIITIYIVTYRGVRTTNNELRSDDWIY
jgi:hypothetical protein